MFGLPGGIVGGLAGGAGAALGAINNGERGLSAFGAVVGGAITGALVGSGVAGVAGVAAAGLRSSGAQNAISTPVAAAFGAWAEKRFEKFGPRGLSPSFNGTTDQCFPANTIIFLADNANAPISTITVGDHVLAYDQFGKLQPRRVTKLYRNVTTEWLKLEFTSADGEAQSLTVTPGHRFLNEHGSFEMIADIAARGGRMIDADGLLL